MFFILLLSVADPHSGRNYHQFFLEFNKIWIHIGLTRRKTESTYSTVGYLEQKKLNYGSVAVCNVTVRPEVHSGACCVV